MWAFLPTPASLFPKFRFRGACRSGYFRAPLCRGGTASVSLSRASWGWSGAATVETATSGLCVSGAGVPALTPSPGSQSPPPAGGAHTAEWARARASLDPPHTSRLSSPAGRLAARLGLGEAGAGPSAQRGRTPPRYPVGEPGAPAGCSETGAPSWRRPGRASSSETFCSKPGPREKEKDAMCPSKGPRIEGHPGKTKITEKQKPLSLIMEKQNESEGNRKATPVLEEGTVWLANAKKAALVLRCSSPQRKGQPFPSR